jgi:hypothetical protein
MSSTEDAEVSTVSFTHMVTDEFHIPPWKDGCAIVSAARTIRLARWEIDSEKKQLDRSLAWSPSPTGP